MWSDLMESGNKPDAEEAGELLANFDRYCQKAARALAEADVFLLVTGAGFSADSGLAIYRDVAKVPAYQARDLDYSDICMPHWQFDDPELFYGFWGQCFNDYRKTQPHEGYSILHRWKQDKNFDNNNVAETISARIERKVELQRPFDDEIVERHAPYLVKSGPAGAFFSFTSNVDAHLHDLFEAHEIHECHGNIESWQCSDPYCDAGVFRAPLDHSFEIDMETMLAPSVQGDTSSSSKNDTATQAGKKSSNSNHVPHIGQVGGSNRTQPLQKMPPPKEPNNWRTSTSIATDSEGNDVFPNWPQCALCKAYARPAILMFGDARWKRDIAQGERWNLWKETVLDLCEKRNSNNPLKVCIVEVGCGLNVPTCRFASERMVEDVARKGGDVVLVRVNPDFPLASDSDVNDCVIPIMARGLDAIKRIDKHYRGM
ncbi:expressed unknown protein [Seminavis robusta]|uniref:Deacetylase sirtuin-type domain-containing protein n=1 Tax=Seminavis robusta TaxID=568900 RepID=A0A9N8EN81_9STRA|nr:expressed unknown protein [Seminavis robusta]|eukprot:Sro1271_g258040.1 n/a (429) ;mRNA; f:2637-3923